MGTTAIRTTGKHTELRAQLRELERQVDVLVDVPLRALPHTTRALLRNIASLFITARWTLEDHDREDTA